MKAAERAARNEQVVALFRAGRSGPRIARKLGMSDSGVYKILAKAGLTAKDGGRHAFGVRFAGPPHQPRALLQLRRKHRAIDLLCPPVPQGATGEARS